jgi:hypothetical protein
MSAIPPSPRDVLIGLLDRLNARAAGCWRIADDGRTLEQTAFASAPEMPADVASAFASATRSVPLERADLGIVCAATTGQVVIVHADQASGATGSARWLREFGAERSVSLPLREDSGTVRFVMAVALTPESPDDSSVAAILRQAFCRPGA